MHVKKGDTVTVLTGKDRGKTGEVLKAFPRENKVLVENINVVKKAVRNQGIVAMSRPIDVSNVAKAKSQKTAKDSKKTSAPKAKKESSKKEKADKK